MLVAHKGQTVLRPTPSAHRPREKALNASVKLCLIVARARNGVIGKDNDLPWRLCDDLKHFKATTKGCPVIMGRKTWESLPRRPLPGRDNIVLSRDGQYSAPGARVYTSIDAAIEAGKGLAAVAGKHEIFVTGGSAIYENALPFADRLYITEVDVEMDGDATFPDFDEAAFEEVRREAIAANEKNEYDFTIRQLDRRA
ncbi:MAG: dihydrofolate reductase [Henriciella sp.]|nr:dihydrofolate reductase [Henriciella sp.]